MLSSAWKIWPCHDSILDPQVRSLMRRARNPYTTPALVCLLAERYGDTQAASITICVFSGVRIGLVLPVRFLFLAEDVLLKLSTHRRMVRWAGIGTFLFNLKWGLTFSILESWKKFWLTKTGESRSILWRTLNLYNNIDIFGSFMSDQMVSQILLYLWYSHLLFCWLQFGTIWSLSTFNLKT